MKCPRCHGENFSRMTGLALVLSNVAGQPSVGVIGIHCRKCNLLMLEMSPSALPKDSIERDSRTNGAGPLFRNARFIAAVIFTTPACRRPAGRSLPTSKQPSMPPSTPRRSTRSE